MKAGTIVIGKRVTFGGAVMALSTALVDFFPDHATAIVALATVVIFIGQIVIVNRFGVTQ